MTVQILYSCIVLLINILQLTISCRLQVLVVNAVREEIKFNVLQYLNTTNNTNVRTLRN